LFQFIFYFSFPSSFPYFNDSSGTYCIF
jgi:hypothetical protein